MKRATSMLGALALMAVGFLFAVPAANAASETYNGITCDDYPVTNGDYPADGTHFKVCFSYLTTNAEQIKLQIYGAKVNVRDFLQQQGVTVYYFANRTANNLFFSGHPGYGSGYETTTARCANTYRKPNGPITISIFQSCTFASGQVVNQDLKKVTSHEKGHAFALALAKSQGNLSGPDRSPGVESLGDYDRNNIGNITTICGIFGQHLPSAYEIDLGASTGQVCSNTNTVIAPYTGLTAKQIHDLRAPYFVNPSAGDKYAELWAEQFSILDNGVGGQQNLFDMTDTTIGNNRFRCSMRTVTSFWHTLNPVGPNNPHISFRSFPVQDGCPSVSEQDQWH